MLNYAETSNVSTIVSVASLPQDQHQDAPASILHDRAVKAYRARAHFYREQGKNYDEAQRLALC